MKTLIFLGVLSVGGGALLLACGSHSGTDPQNSNQSGGYNVSGGGAGSSVVGGQVAQNTADGTAAISADTAASLTADKCAGWSAEPEGGQPPVIEFIIDASGSMGSDPADPSNPNGPKKWAVMTQTMPTVFDSLPDNFAVGDMFYNLPSGTYAGRQSVAIAPLGAAGSQQRTAMNGSLAPTNITPNGYTPTYNAWEFGLSQLVNWTPVTGYGTSPKAIVLITDGVPTIDRDGRTRHGNGISQAEYEWQIADIQAKGTAAGVKTYVVGVVGSEQPQGATYDPRYMLSLLAVAAGTAPAGCTPKSGVVDTANDTVDASGHYCHVDLSQATNLSTALTQAIGNIANGFISCDYSVPAPPAGQGTIDPAKTALVFNDGAGNYSLILQNTSSTCDKGWVFTDATNSKIHICDQTCNLIQSNAKASLQLVFGCAITNIPLVN